MPAKLNEKGLTRIIKVYGIEQPIAVTLLPNGISFKIAGRGSKAVTAAWPEVVKVCITPRKVKSYLMGDAFAYLVHEAQEKTKRAAKKADKGRL
jgi:hypothetical protein